MRLLALVLLPALAVAAGPSLEIQSVVDLAGSAPPEVAADALIRVAALDQIAKPRRVELYDQAFALALFAPQPYKRRTSLARAIGPSGFLNRAYEQDLDGLSLQLRAVEGLLPLAPQKAREHFLEIAPLSLPQLSCDDFMVYDVDRFYAVLGQVAGQTFSAKEVRNEEPTKFLAGYITTITSAAQVAPVAHLLESVGGKDAEFQSLATAFAGALSRISSDDRSFVFGASAAGPAIGRLAELSRRRQTSPLIVLEAYRQFLASHLAGQRCADDTKSVWSASATNVVSFFNDKLATPPLQPIDTGATTAAKTDGEVKGLVWCEDPECHAMREQYLALVVGENGAFKQTQERQENDWQAKARDFLSAMAAWTRSTGLTPVEHFREKVALFSELLIVVPNGPTREFVLQSMLQFLIQNRVPEENRMEWLLPLSQLAGRVGLDPAGWGQTADQLRRANDSVISLYMALEAVAPRSLSALTPVL
ncbi:MAG TPA: hypothetical protein VG096_03430 [Bryobacteraceae bacterium]|jgi:hypothetical protein|nr:hypothetical protein [Bryobacteraceae bacterium]